MQQPMLLVKIVDLSTQAIDKYKNGVSDIMNMRLKHAIKNDRIR